ncbi:hypothetical protein OAH18_01070 [bacterium]|nr:hypothetical protein [bacterium]
MPLKVCLSIPLLTLAISLVAAKEPVSQKERDRIAFQKKLQHVDPALTGGPFKEWKRNFHSAITDKTKWKQAVNAAKDSDTRTSRAAEVVAFSGEYKFEQVTIGKYSKQPLRTAGKYELFLFRPTHRRDNGKWIKLPEKSRQHRYLMVRGMLPQKHDPYGIVVSMYLGKKSDKEIERLVKSSLKL